MTAPPVRIAVIDNDWTVIVAVTTVAATRPLQLEVLQAVRTLEELTLDPSRLPQVVVLDLFLGAANEEPPSYADIARLVDGGMNVLIYTNEPLPAPIVRAVRAGACGIALKADGPEALVDAIVAAARGEFAASSAMAQALLDETGLAQLTEREVEVLELFADGLEIDQVAEALFVTSENVKKHLNNVSRKYRALGRPGGGRASVREATRDGWLRPRSAAPGHVSVDKDST